MAKRNIIIKKQVFGVTKIRYNIQGGGLDFVEATAFKEHTFKLGFNFVLVIIYNVNFIIFVQFGIDFYFVKLLRLK